MITSMFLLVGVVSPISALGLRAWEGPIDRHALVSRHNVTLTRFDESTPLQVGNGEFAFGMDVTGLQTFAAFNTMSNWGWHSNPLPAGQRLADFDGQVWDTHGRPVRYPMPDPRHPELSSWMAANPHRIDLGRIGFVLKKRDGTIAVKADLENPRQELDLWTGIVTSQFEIDGEPVKVVTACHPTRDSIAVDVGSPLIRAGRLAVFFECPGDDAGQFANFVGDWAHRSHFEELSPAQRGRADLVRRLGSDVITAAVAWKGDAVMRGGDPSVPPDEQRFTLQPGQTDALSFSCTFSDHEPMRSLPGSEQTFAACRRDWPRFWQTGGAIDLSGSTDPRWPELERRIVLSQYLMKVNEAGSLPPQESGLVNNGWFGRFHMEMLWWHAAHWALWNRWPELDHMLQIYWKLLPGAERLAKSEGYVGARWPKCIGPNLREWPHEIHALLIWQQPHPIFFAELAYRAHPTRATLEKWRPIVEATADFLASYAYFDKRLQRSVLGPPMVVVSENTDPRKTQNPTFELGYWRFGLRVAQEWRQRLGLPPRQEWAESLKRLSPLPQQDGVYVLYEGVQDMWTKWTFEHPALTGALGMLPGDGVDQATMRRTLDKVTARWDFNRTWGWDFPMLAMCAARLGEPERAVNLLLSSSPGFQFDQRGYATGGPFPYFPSNGGLLYAAALMAAGWDGAPKGKAPGFPSDGRWHVRWENLSSAP